MKTATCIHREFPLFLILLVTCWRPGYGQQTEPAAAPSFTELQVDPALLLQMEAVWSVIGNRDNPVWPGWDASRTPVMFYLPGIQEVLINHPTPPASYMAYRGPLAKRFPSLMVHNGDTEFAYDGQNTSRKLYGEQTLIVADTLSNRKNWLRGWASSPQDLDQRLADLDYRSLRADPYQQMEMIAHEAFHVFQYKHLKHDLSSDFNARYYPCLSVEGNVGLALEGKAMLEAINTADPQVARRAALRWLALRLDRRKEMNSAAIAFEDDNEFMEGLATYAGLRCMEILQGTTPQPELFFVQGFQGFADMSHLKDAQLYMLEKLMRGEVNVNNDRFGVAPARKRMYSSGLALALILDKLAATSWKQEIAAPQATLTGLIRQHLNPSEDDMEVALQEARDDPELPALYEAKRQLAAEGEDDTKSLVKSIVDGPNSLLVVDWSEFGNDDRGLSYTSFGLRSVDSDRVVYTLVPIQARFGDDAASFQQQIPRPTLDDTTNQIIQFQLTDTVDSQWMQQHLGDDQGGVWKADDMSLTLPGVVFKANSATLRLTGDTVWIKLHKPN